MVLQVPRGGNPAQLKLTKEDIYNAGVFFNFEGKTSGLKNLIMDTAFKSITMEKIAIEQQKSIATVLSTLDSKIASNRAINHYLAA